MYVVGIDRPWIQTPFLTHRFALRNHAQIDKLKKVGIAFVDIDTDRGVDVPASERTQHDLTTAPEQPFTAAESKLATLPEATRGKSLSAELHEVREVREQMLCEVREILDSVRTSGVVDGHHVKNLSQEIINKTLGHEDAYAALVRTREFSPDLYEHALSVGTLAVLMGRLLGYDETRLEHLAMGAMLHDIGLLRLPPELVRPVGTLSKADRSLFDSHPSLGVEILKNSKGIPDDVMRLVLEHHIASLEQAHSDGSLTDMLSHSCRLIRIIDHYDELLTGQDTARPLPVQDALRELYQLSQQHVLDQNLVEHLISQIGIYPLYSLVQLNTGERGIVTSVTPGQLLKPVVLLIQDPERKIYPEPIPVNFSTQPESGASLNIVDVLDAEKEGVQVEEVLANWVAL